MYNCLIVDDEPIAIKVIKNHLVYFQEFKIAGECSNALEAITFLSRNHLDLMFCDIKMPLLTGIDFIKSLSHQPRIILVTAYREFATEAYNLNVIDYLVKPVSFERFAQAINKFLELTTPAPEKKEIQTSSEKDFLFLKADKKIHKLGPGEILYFESLGDYVIAWTADRKIITREKMLALEENLPPDMFIRIHRGFIVSIDKITAIGTGFVEINKKKLPVGRKYKSNLDNLVNLN